MGRGRSRGPTAVGQALTDAGVSEPSGDDLLIRLDGHEFRLATGADLIGFMCWHDQERRAIDTLEHYQEISERLLTALEERHRQELVQAAKSAARQTCRQIARDPGLRKYVRLRLPKGWD